jgi:hypothetical protein
MKGAKRSSKRVFAFSWTGAQFLGRLSPNNRYSQGIVEDFGLVKKLVGGASNGDFVCGPAKFPGSTETILSSRRFAWHCILHTDIHPAETARNKCPIRGRHSNET